MGFLETYFLLSLPKVLLFTISVLFILSLKEVQVKREKNPNKTPKPVFASYGKEVVAGLPYKNFIFFIQLPHDILLWLTLVIFTLHCQTDGRNQNIVHFTYLL